MAAVSSVLFLKPVPGRLEALMRDIARAQKMIKRLGGTLRAYNEVSGPNAGAIAIVVEHSDWKEYGNYMTKLETDKDWQSFVTEINSSKSPNSERVAIGLNVEVPS
ncbi:MAG: hypothetical protein WAU82_10390 [Candidatus Binatus sp.]|uniref:hypothetical protein n=2 Tax=Candidatus Binatus sp. TaxID=2811406 RepID=UPI003BAFEB0E